MAAIAASYPPEDVALVVAMLASPRAAYFTGVRDLEKRLEASKDWERKPKPVVKAAPPTDPAEADSSRV